MSSGNPRIDAINTPITLKCGLTLRNRLVKCPMQETLAQPPLYDVPIAEFRNLYPRWATGGFGLLTTGQIQIDVKHLSTPSDVTIHQGSDQGQIFENWKEWASLATAGGTPIIAQLAHPGKRGSAPVRRYWDPKLAAKAPSAVPVKTPPGYFNDLLAKYLYGEVSAMTTEEIEEVIENFVFAAKLVQKAGFAGVNIHNAHGFLLSQFMSPAANKRDDEFGGSAEGRRELLMRIVRRIRLACGNEFCIAIKLNSADFAEGALTEDEALEHVVYLSKCGLVDYLEVSGGNGEGATSPLHSSMAKLQNHTKEAIKRSTAERESYFAEFGKKIRLRLSKQERIPIQLSGGFKSRTGIATILENDIADLIGMGRTVVLEPDLPRKLLDPSISDEEAASSGWSPQGTWVVSWVPRVLGTGWFLRWFYWNQQRMGYGYDPDPKLNMATEVVLRTLRWGLSLLSSSR